MIVALIIVGNIGYQLGAKKVQVSVSPTPKIILEKYRSELAGTANAGQLSSSSSRTVIGSLRERAQCRPISDHLAGMN